jgi:uncharacterized protein (TIGR03790 family)
MRRLALVIILILCGGTGTRASTYSVTPKTLSAQVGSTVGADWTVDQSVVDHNKSDTLALYLAGTPYNAWIASIHLGSAASGTATFALPLAPGNYELRIYKNGNSAKLAVTSRPIKAIAPAAAARNPNQILVVYNSSDSESVNVAKYYQTARGVPDLNMLGIKLGTGVQDSIDWSLFIGQIIPPIRSRLTTLEAKNKVYYIQLIYRFPYSVNNAPALVNGETQLAPGYGLRAGKMLCSHLMDPFYDAENAYNTLQPTQVLNNNPISGMIGVNFYREPELNAYFNTLSLSQYRQLPGAKRIYSCTHLDSTSKAKAKAIVDHNITAEGTNGPQGTYYFDATRTRADLEQYYPTLSGVQDGHDYLTWDVHRAKDLADAEHLTTVLTEGISFSTYGSRPPVVSHPNAAFFYDYHGFHGEPDNPASPDGFSMAQSYVAGSIAIIVEDPNVSFRTGPAGAANKRIYDALTGGADAVFAVGPGVDDGGAFQNYWGGMVLRKLLQGGTLGDAQMVNRSLHWNHFAVGEGYYRPFQAGPSQPTRSSIRTSPS